MRSGSASLTAAYLLAGRAMRLTRPTARSVASPHGRIQRGSAFELRIDLYAAAAVQALWRGSCWKRAHRVRRLSRILVQRKTTSTPGANALRGRRDASAPRLPGTPEWPAPAKEEASRGGRAASAGEDRTLQDLHGRLGDSMARENPRRSGPAQRIQGLSLGARAPPRARAQRSPGHDQEPDHQLRLLAGAGTDVEACRDRVNPAAAGGFAQPSITGLELVDGGCVRAASATTREGRAAIRGRARDLDRTTPLTPDRRPAPVHPTRCRWRRTV